MYNFNNAEEKAPIQIFPLGESVENVTLDSVEFVSDSNNNGAYEAIDIILKAPNGALLRDRIFPVNPEYVRVRDWIPGDTQEKALEDAHNKLMTRLLHYATKFGLTKEKLIEIFNKKLVGDNSFKAAGQLYEKVMAKYADDRPLYVKTILNKAGYVSLPKYASGFLQEMSEGESKLYYTDREKQDNIARAKSAPSSGGVELSEGVEIDEPDLSGLDEDF